LKSKLEEVRAQTSDQHLWDDKQNAQTLLKAQSDLEKTLQGITTLEHELNSSKELLAMASDDESIANELQVSLKKLLEQTKDLELECLFTGELDGQDCFLELHAGAGGTESHDWAEMLMRMYLRFAEKQGFRTEMIDELAGEEAGIKSVTIKVTGSRAFGWLRTESGVHRLVRISPFNAAGKRQTSFASVWVYPVIDDSIEIDVPEKDLRIDTYRASGAGGQHVNKTDSAVRITHIPTGIVTQSQNDRSQHRNKAEAIQMLKAKLYEIKLREQESKVEQASGTKTDNSWGNQIRSYVLQPYQMVKDHRTKFETSDTNGTLDGNLKDIIFETLVWHASNRTKA
jgi:peptide chain release factor 2